MKKKIFSTLLMVAFTLASTSMFVSCKDYDDDINAKADKSAVSALETTLNQLKADFEAFKAQAEKDHANFATWAAHNELKDQVAGLNQAVNALKDQIANLAKASEVEALIKSVQDQIDALKSGKADQSALDELATKLTALDTKYAELLEKSATISYVDAVKADLQGQIDALKAANEKFAEIENALKGKLDASVFEAFKAELGTKYYTKSEIDAIVSGLRDEIAAAGNIDEAINLVNGVKDQIEGIQQDMEDLKNEILSKLGNYATNDQLQQLFDDANAELEKKADKSVVDEIESYLNAFLGVIEDMPEDKAERLKKFQEVADKIVNGYSSEINILNVLLTKRVTSIVFKPEFDALARPAVEAPALAYQPIITYVNEGADEYYVYLQNGKRMISNNKDYTNEYDGTNMPVIRYPKSYSDFRHNPWQVIADFDRIDHSTYGVPASAYYIINPSTARFDATSTATISFVGNDVLWNEEVESRVGPYYHEVAVPVHPKAADNPMFGNVMKVDFEMTDWEGYIKQLAKNYMDTVPLNAYQKNLGHVSTTGVEIALKISDKASEESEQADVVSDWAVVVPAMIHVEGLADNFADKQYQDLVKEARDKKPDPYDNMPVCRQENKKHLFKKAADAIKYGYTHTVNYDATFDVSKFVEVHYAYMGFNKYNGYDNYYTSVADAANVDNESGYGYGELEQTMQEATFKQLGLSYRYAIVNYTEGDNKTSESAHISGDQSTKFTVDNREYYTSPVFTPRSVNADGTTILDKPATKETLYREPLLKVELLDKFGNIIEVGYIKLQIVEKAKDPIETMMEFDFNFEDETYVDCEVGFDREVTWAQMENILLAKLGEKGYSKERFENEYTIVLPTDVKQYLRNVNAKGEVSYAENTKPLGKVEYTDMDKQSRETNILKWIVSDGTNIGAIYDLAKPDKDGKSTVPLTTYVHFTPKSGFYGPELYVALTIPVGKLIFATGSIEYEKTLTYWYEMNTANKAAADGDIVRDVVVNVPVPVFNAADQKDVQVGTFKYRDDALLERTEFVKDLHNYFFDKDNDPLHIGDVTIKLDNADKFKNLAKKQAVFRFTLPSTEIGNASFNAVNGTWTVKGISGKTYTLYLDGGDTQIKCGTTVIVEIDEKGAIHFVEGEIADDILNYVSHEKRGERETFTAYIMVTTEDACYAPIMKNDLWFNVRFLRPVDMLGGNVKSTNDAPDNWQEVNLNVVSFRDWRYPDVKWKTPDYNKYYQVNLFADQSYIKTDARFGSDTRDANGDLFTANLEKKGADGLLEYPGGTLEGLSIDPWYQIDGLLIELTTNTKGEPVLRYKNNSGVTSGFHIYVPLYAEYVFGQYPTFKANKNYDPFLKAYVQVTVGKTQGNAKQH